MALNPWDPIAHAGDVRTTLAVRLRGREIVLFRTERGRLAALDATCPHRGAPLDRGRVEGETLRCPYHGFAFGPDGLCVDVPSCAPSAIPAAARTPAHAIHESDGLVWIALDRAEADPGLVPRLPGFGSGSPYRHVRGSFDFAAPIARVIENALDVAHTSFVHPLSFGNTERRIVPYAVEERPDEIRATIVQRPVAARGWYRLVRPRVRDVRVELRFVLPSVTWAKVDLGRASIVSLMAHVELDDRRTRTLWIQGRDFLRIPQVDRSAIARVERTLDEDRRIVESLETPRESFDVPADALSVAFRSLWSRARRRRLPAVAVAIAVLFVLLLPREAQAHEVWADLIRAPVDVGSWLLVLLSGSGFAAAARLPFRAREVLAIEDRLRTRTLAVHDEVEALALPPDLPSPVLRVRRKLAPVSMPRARIVGFLGRQGLSIGALPEVDPLPVRFSQILDVAVLADAAVDRSPPRSPEDFAFAIVGVESGIVRVELHDAGATTGALLVWQGDHERSIEDASGTIELSMGEERVRVRAVSALVVDGSLEIRVASLVVVPETAS
jgi:phenylpropionate dioxygenase-like ring-hydroxylating dioxygenase large terminal subunit